jgi:hypothetical protein
MRTTAFKRNRQQTRSDPAATPSKVTKFTRLAQLFQHVPSLHRRKGKTKYNWHPLAIPAECKLAAECD